MGQPVPGVEAAILDENGQEVGPNIEGDLVFETGWPSQMIGVWQNPERSQKYLKNGWFITGDRAYKDEEGYFWFVGRADDMIKTSGERVGPFEVESALISHPDVIEAAVVGKPDPTRGEIIKAFLILREGVKREEGFKEELKKYVKRTLAGHAYPREIEFVDELPKTKSGKIIRRLLK